MPNQLASTAVDTPCDLVIDQHAAAIARHLSHRLWRGVLLPGIGLQLAMLMAMCLVAWPTHATWADDDQQATYAQLPDSGQPPAPPLASTSPSTPTVPATPPAIDAVTAPATSADNPAREAAAEVVSSDQLIGTTDEHPRKPADAVRELSVAPVTETKPLLPADHPAWVNAPADTSTSVHRLFVGSFITNTQTEAEADEALDEPMVAAVQRYLADTVFPDKKTDKLAISPEFIRKNLLDTSTNYLAPMTTQSGTVYQSWVVLRITPEQRDYFAKELKQVEQLERMSLLGVSVAGLLALTGAANFAFNRRRRRYPSTPMPVAMAAGTPPVENNYGNREAMRAMTVGRALPVITKTKKRCCSSNKGFWLIFAAVMVIISMSNSAKRVVTRAMHPHTPSITINGGVFEGGEVRIVHREEVEHESSEEN